MHCALRLKSEPWLNLNLLVLPAYLACHSFIHWLSFILPTVCVRGRLGWRAFTQDLSGTFQPSPSACSWPAAFRGLCNIPTTALGRARHKGTPPSIPGSESLACVNMQQEDWSTEETLSWVTWQWSKSVLQLFPSRTLHCAKEKQRMFSLAEEIL